jgi:hypothetical protein
VDVTVDVAVDDAVFCFEVAEVVAVDVTVVKSQFV